MARWKVFDKDGNERMIHWSNNTVEPVGNYAKPTLEYNGSWMGECSVMLNIRCAAPIDLSIGDYIIYRGEKFVINYDPSVIKKARRESYGESFIYENVKFNALSYELTDIRFLDYVLADNNIHYSSLPKFPFYAASIEDYCDRLQANTNRYCADNGFELSDYWLFVTPSRERTIQRSSKVRKTNGIWEPMPAIEVAQRWESAFGYWSYSFEGESYNGGGEDLTEEKRDVNINIDNQSIWNALSLIKSEFGLNFITRGRSVIVGAAGIPTAHLFKYGKGKGLYEIDRVADQDQQIITKLFAYGSEKNLPSRYYANLNTRPFAIITALDGSTIDLDVVWNTTYFTGQFDSENNGYHVSVQIEGTIYNAICYKKFERETVSVMGLTTAIVSSLSVGGKIYLLSGIDKDKWPKKEYGTENLPNNMAVNVLMLPGFPNQSLYEWVKANGGTDTDDETGLATWRGYTAFFSKDQYQPYILSRNYESLGIREATKYWDGTDDAEEIFPTIEGTGFDVITDADKITDNGIYGEGEEIKGFNILLPNFGPDFDLTELMSQSTEETVISMKDGFCGGRDFKIASAKKRNDGVWICDCERHHDDTLDLWFPYSYNKSIGYQPQNNEPYQINAGDHYVLTGIPLTDTYILANAVKLLEAALLFLSKNDYTRYTYTPKVDEIFMAYQHDNAQKNEGTYISLHDTIKEGSIMLFEDDDLNIDGSVYIDNLSIREYGNAQIPTYEVTLRNDKQVGQIQRIQNKIDSLSSTVSSGESTNIPAIRQLIMTYGGNFFLSKLTPDTAQGRITFAQGTRSEGDSEWGDFLEGATGAAIHRDKDGQWHVEADYLHARRKLTAKEIQIEEVSHVGGQMMLTAAEMVCDYVEEHDDFYRCYFLAKDEDGKTIHNKFKIGDQAIMQSFDVVQWSDGDERQQHDGLRNRYYWRLVIGTDTESTVSDFNDDFNNDFGFGGTLPDGKVVEEHHWIDLSKLKDEYAEGSDAPMAEDNIVQLGYRGNDSDRQNAIVLAGAGTGSPYIDEYEGIDSFSLDGKVKTRIKPGDNRFTGLVQMFADSTYNGQRLGDIFGKYNNDIKDLGDSITKLDSDINNVEQSVVDVRDSIDNLASGNENLLRNTGFTGDYTSMDVEAAQAVNEGTPIYSDPLQYWAHDNAQAAANVTAASGFAVEIAGGYISQQVTRPLTAGQTYCVSFRAKGSTIAFSLGGCVRAYVLSSSVRRYTEKIVVTDPSDALFRIYDTRATVMEIMVTEGNIPNADWIPSPLDNDKTLAYYQDLVYLANAIANASTSILGGLILTQMIRVGNYRDGEMTEETGGMSGLYTSGNSPFLWGGGDMQKAFYTINKYLEDPSYQATDEEVEGMAKFVVTHGGRAILNDIILRGYVYAKGGYFKGEVVAESGVFRNVHSPDNMFALDDDGRMSCKDAQISGSIYTPMYIVTETNYPLIIPLAPDGQNRTMSLALTGLNVQLDYAPQGLVIVLPREEQYLGARVNILNNSGVTVRVMVNGKVTIFGVDYAQLQDKDFGTFYCYQDGSSYVWIRINS